MTTNTPTITHEDFIQRVRDLVLADCTWGNSLTAEQATRLRHTKLLYGVGNPAVRGVCIYDVWQNGIGRVDVIEISATGQESWVQLAGTVIHELAHVVAGHEAGHSKGWKQLAKLLGFTILPAAAGQRYHLSMLRPSLRQAIARMATEIADGHPDFFHGLVPATAVRPRPCSAGVGSRGGRSRGKGSGSRLRLWECGCDKPVKVRIARDDFDATCNLCDEYFVRVG